MYKEKIQNIANAIAKIEDTSKQKTFLNSLESTLQHFPEYVNAVVTMESQLIIARVRYEDDIKEYQEIVSRLDRNRRNQHLLLVDGVNILNRMSNILELEPFYETDINGIHYGIENSFDEEYDCRRAAAVLAKDFVDEIWFESKYKKAEKDLMYEVSQDKASINSTEVMNKISEEGR